jgi:hypothetical protein
LLSSVEGQAAVLATLNPADEDGTQTSLSLDEALVAVETTADTVVDTVSLIHDAAEAIDPTDTHSPSADAPESPPND